MPAEENNLGAQFREVFALADEIARQDALAELLERVAEGKADLADGVAELISGLKQEKSRRVLAVAWHRLAQIPVHPQLLALASAELEHPDCMRRLYALHYLSTVVPEERTQLFDKMSKDADPNVLFEAGQTILPVNRRLALEAWDRAMDNAPYTLASEILPVWIGQYADPEYIAVLRAKAQRPFDQLSRIALWQAEKWHSLDYLDAAGPVPPGPGYVIRCPKCKNELGIREGHVGERARCHHCQHEFPIPPDQNAQQ